MRCPKAPFIANAPGFRSVDEQDHGTQRHPTQPDDSGPKWNKIIRSRHKYRILDAQKAREWARASPQCRNIERSASELVEIPIAIAPNMCGIINTESHSVIESARVLTNALKPDRNS